VPDVLTLAVLAGRRHAQHAHQQRVGDDAEGHAKRPVHQLGGKADRDERQQGNKIEFHGESLSAYLHFIARDIIVAVARKFFRAAPK
jgi:hypothetical protein